MRRCSPDRTAVFVDDKVAIVSLRFNPGFIQTLIAYAAAMRELGCEVEFLLDPAYCGFTELTAIAPVIQAHGSEVTGSWRYAVFVNPSTRNGELGASLKKQGTKILYVYHEPWQISLDFLRGEGLAGTLRAIVAHHMTVPILRLADCILLPSRTALAVYHTADARYNPRATYVPLIFDDDTAGDVLETLPGKRYFSFIGKPCRSHAFDQFTAAMRYAFKAGWDVRFLIAARQPLPDSVSRDPLIRKHMHQIEIRCGRPLNNQEMNRCYAESYCVWNLYRRSTQSGVLPKAFMFGTPVIASEIGSFPEFVQDRVTGRFSSAENHEHLWNAVKEMKENLAAYAMHCRRSFCETFYYRSCLPMLERLLQS